MNRKFKIIKKIIKRLKSLTSHPLAKDRKLQTLLRYCLFHLNKSVLSKPPKIHRFVNDLKFYGRFESGVAGNVYYGMTDFEEMSFVLHFLRENDVFVDIGANSGSYTMLAAGVCRAKTISIEPIKSTYKFLLENLKLNSLDSVITLNIGLGAEVGNLNFSNDKGLMNRVIRDSSSSTEEVRVISLDELANKQFPNLLKIDVEGFEYEVLQGASQTLSSRELKAIIIELNGSGSNYGRTDEEVDELIRSYGFEPYDYFPRTRKLEKISTFNRHKFNTIYFKDSDLAFIKNRLDSAEKFQIFNETF